MKPNWIPIRTDLHEDPAVMWMASELRVREEVIVGYLCRIWSWVDRQCNADTVTNVTLESLGRVTALAGFPELMAQVGWLHAGIDVHGRPFVTIEKFDRWMSRSAKTRAMTRVRVESGRSRKAENVTEMYGKCNAGSDTPALPHNSTLHNNINKTPIVPTGDVTQPKVSRKRKKADPSTPPAYTAEFEAAWSAYQPVEMTKGDKAAAFSRWCLLSESDRQSLPTAIAAYCRAAANTKQKTKHMCSWLYTDWRQWLDPTEAQLVAIDPEERERLRKREEFKAERERFRQEGERLRLQQQQRNGK